MPACIITAPIAASAQLAASNGGNLSGAGRVLLSHKEINRPAQVSQYQQSTCSMQSQEPREAAGSSERSQIPIPQRQTGQALCSDSFPRMLRVPPETL